MQFWGSDTFRFDALDHSFLDTQPDQEVSQPGTHLCSTRRQLGVARFPCISWHEMMLMRRAAKVVVVDLQSLRFRFHVWAGQPSGVQRKLVGCFPFKCLLLDSFVPSDSLTVCYGIDGPFVDDFPSNVVMWVKQRHKPSPSHHHVYFWYVDHSQSWVVYGIVLPTLFPLKPPFSKGLPWIFPH